MPAPPDSIGPCSDGKEYAAASWASADVDVTSEDELGGMSREIVIPPNATGTSLVVEMANGQTRTFTVGNAWRQSMQIKKIKTTSTVSAVQVFV